ncbi:hypothetical protein [Sphingomonas profundi]|uniref:hypothetical protein n=1 Tax=Alterirhizorhabdus profundi TaxID=2681549 RepID=UPI0012E95D64|nr:hypothetical protein [Sphingomonas profundi]
MSDARRIFRIVVWAGVIANWSFGLWVTFGDPHRLLAMLRLGDQPSVLWLYNYAILLMILSLFYIPAARDPFRYRANAWLLVVGRLVPVSTFILGVLVGFMPRGFLGLALADSSFGIVELILLLRIFREGPGAGDYRPAP